MLRLTSNFCNVSLGPDHLFIWSVSWLLKILVSQLTILTTRDPSDNDRPDSQGKGDPIMVYRMIGARRQSNVHNSKWPHYFPFFHDCVVSPASSLWMRWMKGTSRWSGKILSTNCKWWLSITLVAESRHFFSADRAFLWNLFFPSALAESATF